MNAWRCIYYMLASEIYYDILSTTDKIQEWTLNGLSTSVDPGDQSDLVCPLMMINRHQNHKLQIYAEWTAIRCFILCRNPALRGTPPSITISWDQPWQSIWGRWEDILDMMTIYISHRGEFLLLFFFYSDSFTIHPLIILTAHL